jgi:hypothetical protein
MKFEPTWAKSGLFMAYGYVAGFLGGQQNLFLKGVGTMMTLAFGPAGAAVFADWILYVFLLGMLVLAPTQLGVINVGLMKFSVLRFVPAYTVLYIVHGTSVGLFFYQEYAQMDGPSWAGFSVGFLFIFGSLALLSCKPVQDEPEDEDDELSKSLTEPLAPKVEGTGGVGDGGEEEAATAFSSSTTDTSPASSSEKRACDEDPATTMPARIHVRSPSIKVIAKMKVQARRASRKVRRQSMLTQVLLGHHNGSNPSPDAEPRQPVLSSGGGVGRARVSTVTALKNLMTHGLSEKDREANDRGHSARQSRMLFKSNSAPEVGDADLEAGSGSGGPHSVGAKSLRTLHQKATRARRVSSVMIAFGGGLLMSHNMASKKLKVGLDKTSRKHDILRRMTSTEPSLREPSGTGTRTTVGSGGSSGVVTGGSSTSLVELTINEGEEEEEEEGGGGGGGGGGRGTTPRYSKITSENFVIGQRVSTPMGDGQVAQPVRQDHFVEVQLDWTLANGGKATMFVLNTKVLEKKVPL